ncbi:uncharacterized protein A4U43_C04F16830 [Asparagus officinalis]|uniref:Uncharacterized protein n=1 Tax=Asparagus officinalis TaxID=4686 RepID=A0A5P1F1Y7_ASPOF|nr:uncharacterized protein A4U43_C04F16830 [Asparagus officinalis]
MASSSLKNFLGPLERESYVSLLSKLIGEAKHVQNNPPDLIPKEDRVARHVLDALLPVSTSTGWWPLVVRHVSYSTAAARRRSHFLVSRKSIKVDKSPNKVSISKSRRTGAQIEKINLPFKER